MSDADVLPGRPAATVRAPIAVLLVVLGLGFCVLWKLAAGTEQHSWDRGAVAPSYVELTGGHEYAISIPGGVPTEVEDGVSPGQLSCTAGASGIATQRLQLVPEQEGTKATNQIASFTSPVTGQVQIACTRLSAVFVDDADGTGFDYAGVLIWSGVLALAIGLPLGLSVLRGSPGAGEDDQVQ